MKGKIVTPRLEFGKIPKSECIGPTWGEIEDRGLRQDEYGYDDEGPEWEDAYTNRETLEAEQIQQFLDSVGIIKVGKEIGCWATDKEIRRNRVGLIRRLIWGIKRL